MPGIACAEKVRGIPVSDRKCLTVRMQQSASYTDGHRWDADAHLEAVAVRQKLEQALHQTC